MFPRLSKRALFTVGAASAVVAGLPDSRRAAAQQTPRNTLVIAAQIDDLVATDPHHSFEVTGSDLLSTTPAAARARAG